MSHNMELGFVKVCIDNKIATVTFFHPASNSFPGYLLQQLVVEINQLSANEAVNIIVLESENEVFCAGASFDELMAIKNIDEGAVFFSGFANVINAMRKCSKLIIGRVQGKAVGGGVGLIAACDYVIALEKSAIKLSEIAIGIGAFVIEPVIAAFTEMCLAPKEWKSSAWEKQKGLFSKVVVTTDRLNKEIASKSLEMAGYNPEALLEMKKIIWKDTENWDDLLQKRAAISGKLVLSEFTKQALDTFKK